MIFNHILQQTISASSTIALSIEGAGSVSLSCSSQHSLMKMLEEFVAEDKLLPSMITRDAAPSIIYMRRAYKFDDLATTTLECMGLAG